MPGKTIQHLEEALQQLKLEQDKAMSLAIYVGMTAAEAKQTEERGQRIYELYGELITLLDQEYRKAHLHAKASRY